MVMFTKTYKKNFQVDYGSTKIIVFDQEISLFFTRKFTEN
jgi:hypothetical protein